MSIGFLLRIEIPVPITLLKNEEMENEKAETKFKNIKAALDIIESNTSAPLMRLISGIKSLRDDLLGPALRESVNSLNIKSPSAIDVITKKRTNALRCNNVDSPQKKTKCTSPIRKVKLTKRQLMRERYLVSSSKDYLKYPHKCKSCIQSFNYEENLEDHNARKHDAKLGETCDICMQVHPVATLDVHMRRHFCRYMCVECREKFISRKDAVYHYARQHVIKFKCGLCAYAVSDLRKLKVHRVMKHKTLCKQCCVVFSTPRKLTWHLMVKHKNGNTGFSQDSLELPI